MSRATPLPPDERRRAILDAVLPLVLEHGADVTTKQIAEASGVAEGTIFRVFPSKSELVGEAVRQAIDPAAALAEIEDRGFPDLAAAVVAVVATLQQHSVRVHRLLPLLSRGTDPHGGDRRQHAAHRTRSTERMLTAIERTLEPHAAELGTTLRGASGSILALALGSTFSADAPPPPERVAHVLLHGITSTERP